MFALKAAHPLSGLLNTIKSTSTLTQKQCVVLRPALQCISPLTTQVLSRCYHTLIPREDYVSVILQSNPDLYGPFWTLTTVVFSLFVFSSLASSISSYLSSTPWDYDFTLLSVAVGIVYAYGMGVPVALWAVLKYLGVSEWGLLDALAVWGYGMTVWMYVFAMLIYYKVRASASANCVFDRPVALLCIIPSEILRWTCAGFACCLSGFFLVRNLYPVLAMVRPWPPSFPFSLMVMDNVGAGRSQSHPPLGGSYCPLAHRDRPLLQVGFLLLQNCEK
jgi:hypothetical protein